MARQSGRLRYAPESGLPCTWMLDGVSDEGVKLTAAGLLPPAVVVEAVAVLEDRVDWVGKGNREDLTISVRDLRGSAQQLRLHPYPRHPASPTVQDLLDEIAHDPTAIFWG